MESIVSQFGCEAFDPWLPKKFHACESMVIIDARFRRRSPSSTFFVIKVFVMQMPRRFRTRLHSPFIERELLIKILGLVR